MRNPASLELSGGITAYNFKPTFEPKDKAIRSIDEDHEFALSPTTLPAKPPKNLPPPLPADAAPVANPLTLKFAGIEAGVMKSSRAGSVPQPLEQLSLSKRNLKDRLRRARSAAMAGNGKPEKKKVPYNEDPIYLPRQRRDVATHEGRSGFIFEGPLIAIGLMMGIIMCMFMYFVVTHLKHARHR